MSGTKLGIGSGAGQSVFEVGCRVCMRVNGVPTIVTPVYSWDIKTQAVKSQIFDMAGNVIPSTATLAIACDEDCEACAKPELELLKEGTLVGTWAVGQKINYTLTTTNKGNQVLAPVTVTDPVLNLVDYPVGATLAPGASVTTVLPQYTITQADIDRGHVDNQATATGTAPDGSKVSDVSDDPTNPGPGGQTVVSGQSTSAVTIVKKITSTGPYVLGSIISGTYTVCNTGNTTLSGTTVTDSNAVVVGGAIGTLAAGACSSTATWSRVVNQAEVDAGQHLNTATVNATNPTGGSVSSVGNQQTPIAQTNSMAVVKTGTPSSNPLVVGSTVSYTIQIQNTGTTTLTNASVTDAKLSMLNVPVVPATIAPGAAGSITRVYTVSAADIAAGGVANTATGNATSPGGPLTGQDTENLIATPAPVTAFITAINAVAGATSATGVICGRPVTVTMQNVAPGTQNAEFRVPGASVGSDGLTDAAVYSPAATAATPVFVVDATSMTPVGARRKVCIDLGGPVTNPVLHVGDIDRTTFDFSPYAAANGLTGLNKISGSPKLTTSGLTVGSTTPGTTGSVDYSAPINGANAGYGSIQLTGTMSMICWDYVVTSDQADMHWFNVSVNC